ncbi:MAG TPA: DUF2520 domain-containing protein [Flavobacteriales bacterium]|nr:DUF2520 domain-containing protein [Flavobacteriales bacterium]
MATILIIGTGRAASHLGHAMRRSGHRIEGVVGRSAVHSRALGNDLQAPAFLLNDGLPTADILLIAVSDDAIADVAMNIPIGNAVVIHASGASDLDKLLPHPDRAVLWPVMSLSPGAPMDFAHVPLVIDANTDRAHNTVRSLAGTLSDHVTRLTHAQRELVHATAAVSLNFPVHLLMRAQALLKTNDIDPTILGPSFRAMAEKATSVGASEALTGPARRGDLGTVRHHLDRLGQDPELRAAYALLSSMILRAYGHPDHGYKDV